MGLEEFPNISGIMENKAFKNLQIERNKEREAVKERIAKIQKENRRNFNKNCKAKENYELNDLVAIKRTQYDVDL